MDYNCDPEQEECLPILVGYTRLDTAPKEKEEPFSLFGLSDTATTIIIVITAILVLLLIVLLFVSLKKRPVIEVDDDDDGDEILVLGTKKRPYVVGYKPAIKKKEPYVV